MKHCDRWRGNSVLVSKPAVKVTQFIGKSSVGTECVLWRRLIVGYDLHTLLDIIRLVRGDIFLKLVPVFGLTVLNAQAFAEGDVIGCSLFKHTHHSMQPRSVSTAFTDHCFTVVTVGLTRFNYCRHKAQSKSWHGLSGRVVREGWNDRRL